MDFADLSSAETGAVVLLEFSWPWPSLGEAESETCIAYVVMKRPEGFMLCLPQGFIPEEELQAGQEAEGPEGLGPSFVAISPAVRLTEENEWRATDPQAFVSAVVVDLPASFASALALPDLQEFGGAAFAAEDVSLFPLASDVLRQTREWAAAALGESRSGYQTAASDQAARVPKAKPKRHTVASLAQEQAGILELIQGLSKQIAALQPPAAAGNNSLAQGPAVAPPPGFDALPAPSPALDLGAPLSLVVPPAQHVPKSLATLVGPPPRRQQPKRPSSTLDLEGQLQEAVGGGDAAPGGGDVLTQAVLSQGQALATLVGHLVQGTSDPMLEPTSSTSVRGAIGRQKLQQELAGLTGGFAKRVRENALRRMDPTGMSPPDQATLVRYLERFGGFGRQKNTGLIAWQVAQAADLLAKGSYDGAADVLALLLLMLDQSSLDNGDFGLAWVLTLQGDPPLSLFQDMSALPGPSNRVFSPLADTRWITTALSYLKEIDAIGTRKQEVRAPTKPPAPPKVTSEPPTSGEPALSKKQARAAAWAAKRASNAKAST